MKKYEVRERLRLLETCFKRHINEAIDEPHPTLGTADSHAAKPKPATIGDRLAAAIPDPNDLYCLLHNFQHSDVAALWIRLSALICQDCDGNGHDPVCERCNGTGWEPENATTETTERAGDQ